MVFLKDFNKVFNDIIKSKKFDYNRTLEVKADKANIFSWSAKSALKDGRGSSELVFNQKEEGVGEMKCTFKHNPKGKDDTMEIEATSKDTPLTEVKAKIAGGVDMELTMKYEEDPNWGGQMKLNYVKGAYEACPDVQFSVGSGVIIGAGAKLGDKDGFAVLDYAAGMQYTSGEGHIVSVQCTKKLNELTFSGYLPKFQQFGKAGAQVVVKNLQTNPEPAVTLGGMVGLNDRADLRWACDLQKYKLTMGYEYKFASNMKGSFCSSVDSTGAFGPMGFKCEVSV